MNNLSYLSVYEIFLNFYGLQNWWPVHRNTDPFVEISVGAVLTQNTSWKNVEKAIENLINEDLLNFDKLCKVETERLQKLIKPSGFYVRKSKTIKEMSCKLNNKNRSKISRDFLLSIHGIGKETADSILLYGLNKPYFVIDSYTKRIFTRIGLLERDLNYDQIQEVFSENLPEDTNLYKEYHALIVKHGKTFCRKNPLCSNCPLFDNCRFRIYNV